MTKTQLDTRFEVLAELSNRYPADFYALAEDRGLDAEGLLDALAGIMCMNIGLIFNDDGRGYLESIQIAPASWKRAKVAAQAYVERTNG